MASLHSRRPTPAMRGRKSAGTQARYNAPRPDWVSHSAATGSCSCRSWGWCIGYTHVSASVTRLVRSDLPAAVALR